VRLAYSCQKQFSPREILNGKAPEPGGASTVEAEGIPRNDLDATTGDIPWNLDLRAHDEFPAINAGFQ
jgi:hypothetical protein